MNTRIRVISGSVVVGATLILTGTAAQAMTLSGTVSHSPARPGGGDCGSNDCWSGGGWGNGGGGNGCGYNCGGGCGSYECSSAPPSSPPCTSSSSASPPPVVVVITHTPPPVTQTPTPTPSATTSAPRVVTVTVTPTPTSSQAVVSASPVPSGPPQTGGGLSSGSDMTLAAGGAVAALSSGGFGLFAIRRWQQAKRLRNR
jgi:hypothetical protein